MHIQFQGDHSHLGFWCTTQACHIAQLLGHAAAPVDLQSGRTACAAAHSTNQQQCFSHVAQQACNSTVAGSEGISNTSSWHGSLKKQVVNNKPYPCLHSSLLGQPGLAGALPSELAHQRLRTVGCLVAQVGERNDLHVQLKQYSQNPPQRCCLQACPCSCLLAPAVVSPYCFEHLRTSWHVLLLAPSVLLCWLLLHDSCVTASALQTLQPHSPYASVPTHSTHSSRQ